jgi:hypothetical protein
MRFNRRTTVCWIAGLLCAAAFSQGGGQVAGGASGPEAEFHLLRLIYATRGGGGSHGYFQPWWAIDYPLAEQHFLRALHRMTNLSLADDSIHVPLSDARIFDYPFMFLQQPGRGRWSPTDADAANLREYLLRGGFLLVDDFHGEYEWEFFQSAMHSVFPDRALVDIPEDDQLMNVVFEVDRHTPIPGRRHLYVGSDGKTEVNMEGAPHWRGVYDDRGRVMVAINHNSDMGDAWEHEDDPVYPVPMTVMAYKFGVNYVIYAMTH